MIPCRELADLKARNPVHAIAGEWVRLRARRGGGWTHAGPCPICSRNSASKSAGRFECNAEKWVCAVCDDGGDVIKLVMKREGIDFMVAIERLGGTRAAEDTPLSAKREGAAAFRRGDAEVPPDRLQGALAGAWLAGWRLERDRERQAHEYRERERKRLYDFWLRAAPWRGSPVEDYLRGRGLDVPDNAQLRFMPDAPLFADGREIEPVLLHRGLAMLAAIIGPSGRFAGLHFTWLDPAGPKGKAVILDHTIGEPAPSKKVRGTKKGGFVDLGGCPIDQAERLIAGEGIETVLAVFTALKAAGRDMEKTAFRCGVDLGNLAGKALETVPHPDLKTETGRARRVPGSAPDMDSPAMPVPETIAELILLGDGDSDPFTTQMALRRAAARHARDGRRVGVRFAPAGLDFNDLLQANGECTS